MGVGDTSMMAIASVVQIEIFLRLRVSKIARKKKSETMSKRSAVLIKSIHVSAINLQIPDT